MDDPTLDAPQAVPGSGAPGESGARLSVPAWVLVGAGVVWLLVAFALFYRFQPFHLYIRWLATHTPAWMTEFQKPWRGVPWDVLGQGGLTLALGALAMWLGRELWPRLFDGNVSATHAADADLAERPRHNENGTAPRGGALAAAVWGGGLVLGLWGTVIFLLGLAGAWRWPRAAFVALFAASAVAAAMLRRGRLSASAHSSATDPAEPAPSTMSAEPLALAPRPAARRFSPVERVLIVAVVAVQALAFLYAMTPSVQSDGLRYHLAAPQEWLKAGGPVRLPFNAFSDFPSTVEMLFLAGLALAGDLLAKGFHFLFLPLSTLAVASLAREVAGENDGLDGQDEQGGRRGLAPCLGPRASALSVRPSLLAAAVWGTLPITVPLAGWEYIDLALVFFTLGVVHFLAQWLRTGRAAGWVAAALFGGLLVASKYTGVVTVALGGVVLALGSLARRDTIVRAVGRAVAFGLIAAAFGVPWWAKNAVHTHNPVYPLAYSLFGSSGEWTATCADIYAKKLLEKGTPRTLAYFLALPWNTACHADVYEGFDIGPFFWVLTPWVALYLVRGAWRWRRRRADASLALWTGFLLVFWFFTYQSNRFLMPVLALAAAVAAVAVGEAVRPRVPRALRVACGVAVALPLAYGMAQSAFWLLFDEGRIAAVRNAEGKQIGTVSGVRWPAYTLGFMDRDAFLAERLPRYYPAARYASQMLRPGQKVLLVGEHRKMHWRCAVEGNDWYDAPRIEPFLRAARTAGEALDAMAAAGFTHVFFDLDEWGWPADPRVASGQAPVQPGTAWWYNRRHFTQREVDLLATLLRSPRLAPALVIVPGRVWLARLEP